jgi:hypothetical protein
MFWEYIAFVSLYCAAAAASPLALLVFFFQNILCRASLVVYAAYCLAANRRI